MLGIERRRRAIAQTPTYREVVSEQIFTVGTFGKLLRVKMRIEQWAGRVAGARAGQNVMPQWIRRRFGQVAGFVQIPLGVEKRVRTATLSRSVFKVMDQRVRSCLGNVAMFA